MRIAFLILLAWWSGVLLLQVNSSSRLEAVLKQLPQMPRQPIASTSQEESGSPPQLRRWFFLRKPTKPNMQELLLAVTAELRSGTTPAQALAHVLQQDTTRLHLPHTQAALGLHLPVAPALMQDSMEQHSALLAGAATCWQVSETAGAGLAQALDRLLEAEQDRLATEQEIQAQLAGPRSSVHTLALLPLLGILLGTLIGADPLGWLLGGPVGWFMMFAGLIFQLSGLRWAKILRTRVEKRYQ